jgi:hypothetical protein
MSLDQRQDYSRYSKKTYGGIVAGAVAVVVVIAVLLIGRAVYVNFVGSGSESRMNESTTCREFLAADSENQASVMKRLFLKYKNTEAAADPFIVQNAQFECGPNPDMTLGQLAK